MPRLRTSTGLSVLALLIGIAGTGWLSALTADWNGPIARSTALQSTTTHARRHRGAVQLVQRHHQVAAEFDDTVQAAAVAPVVELIPLAMPADHSQSWDQLRGHLDGRVVLHIHADASGHVDQAASLVESSGDAILDQHALRSVRGWRFAVPTNQPAGLSGDLPMRFSSHGDGITRLP